MPIQPWFALAVGPIRSLIFSTHIPRQCLFLFQKSLLLYIIGVGRSAEAALFSWNGQAFLAQKCSQNSWLSSAGHCVICRLKSTRFSVLSLFWALIPFSIFHPLSIPFLPPYTLFMKNFFLLNIQTRCIASLPQAEFSLFAPFGHFSGVSISFTGVSFCFTALLFFSRPFFSVFLLFLLAMCLCFLLS